MAQIFGIDIVAVGRVKRAAEGQTRLLDDFFSREELACCVSRRHPHARLAAILAVKEALLKAAGIGLHEGLRFREIEVLSDDSGRPTVRLHGRLREIIGDTNGGRCLVSSGFTDDLACAVVALQHQTSE
ncbi:MAG: holo-ACP synthase [Candidatus Zixiibacteriota bacterium]